MGIRGKKAMIKNHNLKLRVANLLEHQKDTRDCDISLISEVWQAERPDLAEYFLYLKFLLKEGKLTMPESIKRQRQRLQQQVPELRGERYKERQRKGGR